ncbi:MAG: L,D-transpeptidase family protein [Planctomycetes bacterium]|nr:L,D-transpeptidase family protein [Planctomycetota bacterium]
MKKFIFLVIVIVVGYFVYTKYFKKPAAPEPPSNPPVATQPPAANDEQVVNTDGMKLFKDGEFKSASRQLEKELKSAPASEQPTILSTLAQCYDKLENKTKAVETWKRLVNDFPSSQLCGDAYYALGRNESETEKQMENYKNAVEKYPESAGAKMAACDLGDYYLSLASLNEVERQAKARKCYTLALKNNLSAEKRADVKRKLEAINRNLFFSSMINPSDSIAYKIQPGDNIWKISRNYKLPEGSDSEGQQYRGLIRLINHMQTSNIRAGDTLKVITGKFSMEVDKSAFILTLYLNGEYIKEYKIAHGNPKESPTPEGTFHIKGDSRQVNPVWYFTDKTKGTTEAIPFGDPRHVIGTRWMGFKENPQLGIHGTSAPESIGKAVTNGCIRLVNQEVEELFDIVGGDTEVVIHE